MTEIVGIKPVECGNGKYYRISISNGAGVVDSYIFDERSGEVMHSGVWNTWMAWSPCGNVKTLMEACALILRKERGPVNGVDCAEA